MSTKRSHPYRLDQWIKVDAGTAGELFVRPCRICSSDFVWRYGCINQRCVPRRSISQFFLHPLTWMAPKKMFWSCIFFMPRTTKEDHEKIFKNPDQYKQQHSKRYKQSATCHIFYLQNPLKMIPKKGLGIIRVIYQIEKSHQNNLG